MRQLMLGYKEDSPPKGRGTHSDSSSRELDGNEMAFDSMRNRRAEVDSVRCDRFRSFASIATQHQQNSTMSPIDVP